MFQPGRTPIDFLSIIAEFYDTDSITYGLLLNHGRQVAEKALQVAARVRQLNPDTDFLREAAFLHDIGIFMTASPALGCRGKYPYICHGIFGRKLLEERGLYRHALVCERHVGTGISITDIQKRNLPLPLRDMLPVSIEERIICYADKFYSKVPDKSDKEFSVAEIQEGLKKYGQDTLRRFQQLHAELGGEE